MKIYDEFMSDFDTAMVALLNDDDWMFAYCCDQMRNAGDYDRLDTAKRLRAAKIEADLMNCPF